MNAAFPCLAGEPVAWRWCIYGVASEMLLLLVASVRLFGMMGGMHRDT